MASYRQKMVIQKKQKEQRVEARIETKGNYNQVRSYLVKSLNMYKTVAPSFIPLSDEDEICRNKMLKLTIELEILERGTYEERKEVINKYGRSISETIL